MFEKIELILCFIALIITSTVLYLFLRSQKRCKRKYLEIHFDHDSIEKTLSNQTQDIFKEITGDDKRRIKKAWEFIRELEAQREIFLTPAARQMLLLPIIEFYSKDMRLRRFFTINEKFALGIDQEQDEKTIQESIRQLMDVIQNSPSNADVNSIQPIRSTVSVVKAFWKGFCHIPPFCSGEDLQ